MDITAIDSISVSNIRLLLNIFQNLSRAFTRHAEVHSLTAQMPRVRNATDIGIVFRTTSATRNSHWFTKVTSDSICNTDKLFFHLVSPTATLTAEFRLLEVFDIPESLLPQVMPSSGVFGYTEPSLFGGSIPVAGVAGDQQAALFGQCCYNPGDAKNTYGTGGFLLMNTGENPVFSKNGLVTTIAWGLNGKVYYALEGSVFICGAAVQWLRDGLGLVDHASQTEEIASTVPDSGGVYFVPAFVGLGAPYWDPYARGSISGLTRGTTRAHIVRAVLDSMAFQTCDVLALMQSESGITFDALNVDGGASSNNLLLKIQADLLGKKVLRPSCIETTALGAAYLAGLGVGAIASTDSITSNRSIDTVVNSEMDILKRMALINDWHKAVDRSRGWINN